MSPGAAPARTAGPRRVRFTPGLWAACLFLGLITLAGIAPGLLAPASPTETDVLRALQAPSSEHLLGTDANGRDVLSRIIHGARPSLLAGLGATALAVVGGTVLGLLAALGGRVLDEIVMRLVDVVLSLPGMLLALLVLSITGPGTGGTLLAIAVFSIPIYARLIRVQAMVIKRSEYVEAATSLGLGRPRIIIRHILPNAFAPLVVLATIGVGAALVAASSLSFLGFGPQPPDPEWGAMLSDGRDYFSLAWWIAIFPGAAISLTVLSITVVGRRLQRRSEASAAPRPRAARRADLPAAPSPGPAHDDRGGHRP
ncbi:ABC transporter permease [Streptomyces marincola]|uniref:ABC transporter permease n=1 Tax=Streptomyces marincola TaxID=2878388 RepID=UPI001CF1014A|nr:ABC transporter permease [Streptomyces marincola]UCM87070.1 ABC transporter permease [Streptomyces marincola]